MVVYEDDLYEGRCIHNTVKFMKLKKTEKDDPHIVCKPKQIYITISELRTLKRIRRVLRKKSYIW